MGTLAATFRGSSQPRGVRNNNPGNIIDSPFARSQPGYQGSDGTFARFANPDQGRAAAENLLSGGTYHNLGQTRGLQGIFERYAPAGHGDNNPTAYAARVARQLGVDPRAPINTRDPRTRRQLYNAIHGVENGVAPTQQGRWFSGNTR